MLLFLLLQSPSFWFCPLECGGHNLTDSEMKTHLVLRKSNLSLARSPQPHSRGGVMGDYWMCLSGSSPSSYNGISSPFKSLTRQLRESRGGNTLRCVHEQLFKLLLGVNYLSWCLMLSSLFPSCGKALVLLPKPVMCPVLMFGAEHTVVSKMATFPVLRENTAEHMRLAVYMIWIYLFQLTML